MTFFNKVDVTKIYGFRPTNHSNYRFTVRCTLHIKLWGIISNYQGKISRTNLIVLVNTFKKRWLLKLALDLREILSNGFQWLWSEGLHFASHLDCVMNKTTTNIHNSRKQLIGRGYLGLPHLFTLPSATQWSVTSGKIQHWHKRKLLKFNNKIMGKT